jgi:uncharacterized LabA/DUF88 family protein
MSDQRLKIAVFIDFDNIEIGVKTTLGRQFDIGAVLEAIKERGEIITKVAYGDWKRAGDHGRAMSQHAVRLVQRVMTPGGDKNGADINLALDALEMAFTHAHINAFVIVGGDSDFITLVEKLKQYDRKVFVVGGRAFTSQVMQKNCTEFIAYENVTGGAPERPRAPRGDRARASTDTSLDQALPLLKRALKVLADREVSPQLGLLKSTLLQLDSSFSERDYGVSSFRDFAEKLEKQGYVSLKHNGRSTTVELPEDDRGDSGEHRGGGVSAPPDRHVSGAAPALPERALPQPPRDDDDEAPTQGNGNGNLAEGVALIRKLLAEATTPPRWPMYVRQLKQFIRNARPDFDERRYGSILDLMRACQKDGFLRLERDRQGGLRVFASGPVQASSLPHGWSTLTDEPAAQFEPAADTDERTQTATLGTQSEGGGSEHEIQELGAQNEARVPVEDPDDSFGNVEPALLAKAKRARRAPAKVQGGPSAQVAKPKRGRKTAKPAEARTQNADLGKAERPRRVTRRRTG